MDSIDFVRIQWTKDTLRPAIEDFAISQMTSCLSRVLMTPNVCLCTCEDFEPAAFLKKLVRALKDSGIHVRKPWVSARKLDADSFVAHAAFLWPRRTAAHGFVDEDIEVLQKPRSLLRELAKRQRDPAPEDDADDGPDAADLEPEGVHPSDDTVGAPFRVDDSSFLHFLDVLRESRERFVDFADKLDRFLRAQMMPTNTGILKGCPAESDMGRLRTARSAITTIDDILRRLNEHVHSEQTCELWARGFQITKSLVTFAHQPSVAKYKVSVWGRELRVWYTGSFFSVTAAQNPDAPENNGVFDRMLYYVVGQAILDEDQLDFEGCMYEAVGKLDDSPPRHPLFFDDANYVLEESLPKLGTLLDTLLDLSPMPHGLLRSLALEECPVLFLRRSTKFAV